MSKARWFTVKQFSWLDLVIIFTISEVIQVVFHAAT